MMLGKVRALLLSPPLLLGGLLYAHTRQQRLLACDGAPTGSLISRLFSQKVDFIDEQCNAVSMSKAWRKVKSEIQEDAPDHVAPVWSVQLGISCEPKTKGTALCLPCKLGCGEDALFVAHTLHGVALGVADGVGGWAKKGVDPALFAWTLMNSAGDHVITHADVQESEKKSAHVQLPMNVLQKAYQTLLSSGKVLFGSSTACIAMFDTSSSSKHVSMYAANLGDSGYVIFRDDKVLFKTTEQQHRFNAPFQLTALPALQNQYTPDKSWPAMLQRTSNFIDLPEQADRHIFELQENDIIVFGTDGFFDNVFPEEALQLIIKNKALLNSSANVVSSCGTFPALQQLAKSLVQQASTFARDEKRESPFSLHASQHGLDYLGGKVDDITVIVAQVKRIQKS